MKPFSPKKKHKSQYILVQIRKKDKVRLKRDKKKRYPGVVKEIPKENH
jgi:hypothetical protein